MRYHGRITTWKDDKGFGFITAPDGGNQVFVHIKSFLNRQRRPIGNEIVTYELTTDVQGRAQAINVLFDGEAMAWAGPSWRLLLAAVFLASMAGAAFAGKLPFAALGLYLVMSAIAFLIYAHDKSAAINDRWRTEERMLHVVSLIGGWPGALAAQGILRHKSKKASFQVVFWGTVILNCGALGWLLSDSGVRALRSILGPP
jgi:uncharacterized membrane protein YsdA (DUF1294 family)/cold shock CspA family protein